MSANPAVSYNGGGTIVSRWSGGLDGSFLAVVSGRSADARRSSKGGLIDDAADTSSFPGWW